LGNLQDGATGNSQTYTGDYYDMCLQEIELEGVGWINMAQDGDSWQAVVNKIMNFAVP
jgi:hypothetical protein